MDEKELKSVAFRYQANPGVGSSFVAYNAMTNIVFSQNPVIVIAVELVDILISDVTGTQTKKVFYAKSLLTKTPISQIRDNISASVFGNVSYETFVQPLFIYNEQPVGFWRPVYLKVNPSDSFTFGFSVRFEPLTAADDSLTIVQRLWFEELK